MISNQSQLIGYHCLIQFTTSIILLYYLSRLFIGIIHKLMCSNQWDIGKLFHINLEIATLSGELKLKFPNSRYRFDLSLKSIESMKFALASSVITNWRYWPSLDDSLTFTNWVQSCLQPPSLELTDNHNHEQSIKWVSTHFPFNQWTFTHGKIDRWPQQQCKS